MAQKAKRHKGTSKRVRLSASGKMLRRKAYGNHLLSKKSGSRKRNIARLQKLEPAARKKARRMLGV